MQAAYNLARWLTGNDAAARDVVQDSCLRAFRFLHRFSGGDARAWLLAIVRNQSYTWLKASKAERTWIDVDEPDHAHEPALIDDHTPERALITRQNAAALHRALAALPPQFREVIVLKELEGTSYKEIAAVIDAPIGTVMSRLARGRALLRTALAGEGEGA